MNNEFKKSKSNNETRYTLESMTAGATGSGSVATSVGSMGKVQKRGNILAQEAGKDKVDASKPRNFVAKNAKMGGAGAHKDKKKAQKQGTEKHKKPYMEALKQKIEDLKSKLNEAQGIGGLGYNAQSLITKLRRDVEEKRLKPTPEAVLAAARELAGDMDFAPQLLVKQVLGQGVAEGFNGEYDDEAGMAQSNLLTTARAVKGLLDTIEDKDNLPEWAQEKIAKAEMMLVSVWDYLQSQKEMGHDPQVEAYGRYDRRDAYQRDYDHSVAGMDRGNNHRDDERHDLDPSDWYIVKDGKMYKVSVYPNQEQEARARGYSPSREEAKARADKEQSVAEGPNDGKEDNFTIDDIKNLERIRDFETLKAQAKELIKGKPARRMKPEKISWFYNHIDTLKSPLAVIKMMYDLMLAGEGNKVIGSRNSMSANSYRSRFGEQGVAEGSEWETRHDEFVTVGDRATPEQINKIVSALGVAAKQASSKRGFLNQIVGKQSNGDLARMAHGAETLAKNIQRNRNAKLGTDERKELGQQLVYAVSLLKRMNGEQGVSEAPEDRTSYQVAKILFDKGIKYDAAKENELINMIGMILVKELMMSPKQARHLISYDEDFVSDTLGELGNMESSVSEVAPPGWEKTVKAMKKHDNIDNPFALAWSMKNKGYKSHKKESADPYFESLASKLDDLKKKK